MPTPLRVAAVGLAQEEVYRVLDLLRRQSAHAALTAIAERSGRLRMAAQGRYQVSVYPAADLLLEAETVDVAVVGVLPGERASLLVSLLEAGIHVVVPPPVAVTTAQYEAVVAAQQTRGAHLLTLAPHRFLPAYQHLARALSEGRLGRIAQLTILASEKVAAAPRTPAFYDARIHGGVLVGVGTPAFDLMRWLAGDGELLLARAGLHRFTEYPQFEDSGLAVYALPGGGTATLTCNWLTPEASAPVHELTLYGTEGAAWVTGGKLAAFAPEATATPPQQENLAVHLASLHEPAHRLPTSLPTSAGAPSHVLEPLVNTILQTLTSGEETTLRTVDALAATRLAVAAHERARVEALDRPQ